MPNGDGGSGFGFDPSIFFQGILDTIIAIINAIIAALNFLFSVLVQVFNFLFGAVANTFTFGFEGLGKVWKSLKSIVDDIFKLKLLQLWKDFLTLLHNIKAFLKPLLDLLRKYRHMFDKFVLQGMKRYLNLIQRLRQILVIFKLFHFKWAKKLDAKLVGLETRVTSKVLRLRAEVNKITTIINLILDPELLIRKNVLLVSLARALNDLSLGITGHGTDFWFGINPGGSANTTALLSTTKAVNDFTDATVSKVGDLYGAAALSVQDYQRMVGT